MVNLLALGQRGVNDERWIVLGGSYLSLRNDHNIYCAIQTAHRPVYAMGYLNPVLSIRNNDQEIQVAVRAGVSPCCRAKHDYLNWPGFSDDPAYGFVD